MLARLGSLDSAGVAGVDGVDVAAVEVEVVDAAAVVDAALVPPACFFNSAISAWMASICFCSSSRRWEISEPEAAVVSPLCANARCGDARLRARHRAPRASDGASESSHVSTSSSCPQI